MPVVKLPDGSRRDVADGSTVQQVAESIGRGLAKAAVVGKLDGKLVDLSAFERDILPLIQRVPLSRLRAATGLSLRYVSLIRRGERTPHPRHWQAFIKATDG